MRATHDVSALRQMLAGFGAESLPGAVSAFSLGAAGPDEVLGATLARGAMHEVYAAEGADMPAAAGFALGLALRAAQGEGGQAESGQGAEQRAREQGAAGYGEEQHRAEQDAAACLEARPRRARPQASALPEPAPLRRPPETAMRRDPVSNDAVLPHTLRRETGAPGSPSGREAGEAETVRLGAPMRSPITSPMPAAVGSSKGASKGPSKWASDGASKRPCNRTPMPPPMRPIVWVRQDFLDAEAGRPDALGLSGFGLDPGRLILVRARDAEQALRAAGDAVRCPALGAVLLEPWGEPKALDLTATRRLALRARESGVTFVLLRMAARPSPSVAVTRWLVRPTLSNPHAATAPGAPAFLATLLRHRAGLNGQAWNLEWDHESRSFRDLPTLSRPVVSVPAGRPARPGAATAGEGGPQLRPFRRTG